MDVGIFLDAIENIGITFFTGVPDSQLSSFCDEIIRRYGVFNARHIVAHNEGGAVALAAGHYMATGRVPCIYMQNSGLGNALNPVVSLAHAKVYSIPLLFLVGWRGEPGAQDEPQHIYQGEITLQLLSDMDIECFIIDKDTSLVDMENALNRFVLLFGNGKNAAFVVRKGALSGSEYAYGNSFSFGREEAIELVLDTSGSDPVISTTGKISRELFELRERHQEGHETDFLTVGSMGHSSMIALGISLEQPQRRIWCIDGDGSVLMHMGSLAIVGALSPSNLIHVVLNNAAHETVGGMPTAAKDLDFGAIALENGYRSAYLAVDALTLKDALEKAKGDTGPIFIEVQVSLGSRPDLGRPTTAPQENKDAFMRFLRD